VIIIAPTAFKGTLTATEAVAAIRRGVLLARPAVPIVALPLSDGGNGLVEAMESCLGGVLTSVTVAGPMGAPTPARMLHVRGRAVVVETADACGLHLVAEGALDPMTASSAGVGQLLRAAAERAVDEEVLWVGLGGSATVDGGSGMAAELGWWLLDRAGRPIPSGGRGLLSLQRIERPAVPTRLPPVLGLADVRNTLLGDSGAARVFGPQKGAGPREVTMLEAGLGRLAEVVKRDLGADVAGLEGAGAAGGLGAAIVAFLDGALERGSDVVMRETGFRDLLAGADLLITGEGAFDAQSRMGKVVGEALSAAREVGVRTLLVAGRVDGPLPADVAVVTGGDGPLSAEAVSRGVRDALVSLMR
jgi:glycerate 2-kinase